MLSSTLIRRKSLFSLQQSAVLQQAACGALYFLILTSISSICPWKSSSLLPVVVLTSLTLHNPRVGMYTRPCFRDLFQSCPLFYVMLQFSGTTGKGNRSSGMTLLALHADLVSCSRQNPAQSSSTSTCPYTLHQLLTQEKLLLNIFTLFSSKDDLILSHDAHTKVYSNFLAIFQTESLHTNNFFQ